VPIEAKSANQPKRPSASSRERAVNSSFRCRPPRATLVSSPMIPLPAEGPLVQPHMAAGQLDWAESAAAFLEETPVARALGSKSLSCAEAGLQVSGLMRLVTSPVLYSLKSYKATPARWRVLAGSLHEIDDVRVTMAGKSGVSLAPTRLVPMLRRQVADKENCGVR
jgi:hypothetical protein